MKITRSLACVALSLPLLAGAAIVTYQLPPETATLRPASGPAFEAAQNNCGACHSADYLEMQPPHKGRAFWEAEVTKMVNVFKAQIPPDDMKLIADYLAENY